jgi:hypothetical protein
MVVTCDIFFLSFYAECLVSGLNLHRTEGIFAIILREVEFSEFSCSEHG